MSSVGGEFDGHRHPLNAREPQKTVLRGQVTIRVYLEDFFEARQERKDFSNTVLFTRYYLEEPGASLALRTCGDLGKLEIKRLYFDIQSTTCR